MKVYKMVLLFIDHDDGGPKEAKQLIEYAHLPICPVRVMSIEEADIGAEFERLFGCPAG